jgi:hypothetical protein
MCKPGTLQINGYIWTVTCCSTDNCNNKIIQNLIENLTEGTSSDVSKSTTLSAYKDTTTTQNFGNSRYLKGGSLIFYVLIIILFCGL